MSKRDRWPMIDDKIIRPRHMPDIEIGATVSIDTGRPIVTVRVGDGDADALSPVEARRVARALVKAAECCDQKTAACKAQSTTALTGEVNG